MGDVGVEPAGPVAVVHAAEAGEGLDRQAMGSGDDLGGMEGALKMAGVDGGKGPGGEAIGGEASLGDARFGEGEVEEAAKALVGAVAGVPVGVAVAD